jgi:hypothetical protein
MFGKLKDATIEETERRSSDQREREREREREKKLERETVYVCVRG